VGLYDERLPWNEDFELNYRIRQAGGRIYSTPALRVDYEARDSLWALSQQYWCYGRGKAMMLYQQPRSLAARQLAPPALVLALLSGLGLAAVGRPEPLLGLLGVYGATSAYVARRATRATPSKGRPMVWAVGVTFACVHLSWGSGLLAELVTHWVGAPRGRSGSERSTPLLLDEPRQDCLPALAESP
jgi:hypothetical protein